MGNLINYNEIEAPIELVGGKGRGLLKLKSIEEKFNDILFSYSHTKVIIPTFFIIPPSLNLKDNYSEIIDSALKLNSENYAVRSSSALEDIGEHSFDGIFETKLDVSEERLIREIYNARKSATSQKAKSYAKEVGVDLDNKMPVIIQAMASPDPRAKNNYSKETGVVYSKFPCPKDIVKVIRDTGYKDRTIEAFLREYDNGRFFVDPSQPIAVSTDSEYYIDQSADLADLALRIENNFNYPIILEFTCFEDGYSNRQINLLQARKLTKIQEAEKFQMPELQEKGLIATTRDLNGVGDFTGEAFCIGDPSFLGGVYIAGIDSFDRRHKKQGYVLVTPFLEFNNQSIDELSQNKKAIVAHGDLGKYHDYEISRKKGLLYLSCKTCLRMGFFIAREDNKEPPIKTGEIVRVVSDGEKGFVFNLSRQILNNK